MRLQSDPVLPNDLPGLIRQLDTLYRKTAQQVNQISEGALYAATNATTAAPTTGTYAQGDMVRNSAPTEVGTPGSKYVVYGWVNVAAGTPGTFVQCRFLTGN